MTNKLDAGLHLEDRDEVLAWGLPATVLRRRTQPDFITAPHSTSLPETLTWRDRVFGLPCQVATSFPPGQEMLSGVRLVFDYPDSITSMPAGFAWLGRHLAQHFTSPDFHYDDGEHGEQRWLVGGVALRHEYFDGMGGGHYLFVYPLVVRNLTTHSS